MEQSEILLKMEPTEVLEEPGITLARKISSETWQNRRVKAKAQRRRRGAGVRPPVGQVVAMVVEDGAVGKAMADATKRALPHY